MYQGRCLCGQVTFTIDGPIDNIVYCHCSRCRRVQGTAFATNGNVKAENFRFLSGEANLTEYKESAEQSKYFCKSCGSPIISKNANHPENTRIRLGSIQSDINERPEAHIFVDSKANWDQITDQLPQYREYISDE